MAEITIGKTIVSFDGRDLLMGRVGDTERLISFDPEGVNELLNWITSLSDANPAGRETYRIFLPEPRELEVSIQRHGEEFSVTGANISQTGINLVEVDQIKLQQNDFVMVTVRFEDVEETIRATVKRCEGDNYALQFVDSVLAQDFRPSQKLKKIVMNLQRMEIARQSK